MILNDKLSNDENQTAAADQLTETQKLHHQQQLEFLHLYRQSLTRLQKEDPIAAASMPGINAAELDEREKNIVEEMGRIVYSKRYSDMNYQYRHVILPKGIAKYIPPGKLMKESEWRTLGVVQTPGWTHYMIHDPEPHILLFKRPLDS